MTEPVVVVAVPGKERPEPIEKGDAGVGVMSANAEDADMQRDQRVAQSRETKSPVSRQKKNKTHQTGRNFEPPGEAIMRLPCRPQNHGDDGRQKSEMSSRCALHFFRASSTARLIAAIMLSARAIFLPAISNAVP